MVDGPTEWTDLEQTEQANRQLVRSFVETVYLQRQDDKLSDFLLDSLLLQHDPHFKDGAKASFVSIANGINHHRRILLHKNRPRFNTKPFTRSWPKATLS
jgi:predicted SnoaL-like aldol condensation-catalyzing enzyme